MVPALVPSEPNACNAQFQTIDSLSPRWAWPVSWAFLCGAVASGTSIWPERWKGTVFVLRFIADPFTAALAQGIVSLRQAWQIASSPLEGAKTLIGRLHAFFRTLLGEAHFRRAILWVTTALAGAFVVAAHYGVEMQRIFLLVGGSVALFATSEQDVCLPWTVGLRVAWAWLLGYWAFAPSWVLPVGVGLFVAIGVGASLASEGRSLYSALWLRRLAAWAITLWLLWVRQPFLAAMGAALALNWEALIAQVHPRPPRAIWRLAWLGLGMLNAMAQASGVAV